MSKDGEELLRELMEIMKDGDWYTVDEIADKLSLSPESTADILENLEEASVIQSTEPLKETGLIRGSSFVDTFFDLLVKRKTLMKTSNSKF